MSKYTFLCIIFVSIFFFPYTLFAANSFACYEKYYTEGPFNGNLAYRLCYPGSSPDLTWQDVCDACVCLGSYTSEMRRNSYPTNVSSVPSGYYRCSMYENPSTPVISGTTNITINNPTSNFVISTDSNDNTIYYNIDWDGNGTVDGTTGYYASGASAPIGHTYTSAGTYTVKAQAVNSVGSVSPWSAPFTITVIASYNCEAGSFNPSLNIQTGNSSSVIGFMLSVATRVYHNVFGGACFYNSSGAGNLFIPTKTSAELNSFINNLPTGVTKANGNW